MFANSWSIKRQPYNGQIPLDILLAVAEKLFDCVWPFFGLVLKRLTTNTNKLSLPKRSIISLWQGPKYAFVIINYFPVYFFCIISMV